MNSCGLRLRNVFPGGIEGMDGGRKPMIDQGNGNCARHPDASNCHDVLRQRLIHPDQQANSHWGQNPARAPAPDASPIPVERIAWACQRIIINDPVSMPVPPLIPLCACVLLCLTLLRIAWQLVETCRVVGGEAA